MNTLEQLRRAFAKAVPTGADVASFIEAVRPTTDPKFGDYQANGCMALAKARKQNPREVAAEVARTVDLRPMAGAPEIAGPGFLNVHLESAWLTDAIKLMRDDPRLGLDPPDPVRTIVIDFSSPNVAKPMHVGHIRSTVIGDSLARILSALGHKVIRDNHLGDWGTQFGMIIWGWKTTGDESAFAVDPVGELTRLYRMVQGKIKRKEDLEKAHAEALRLKRLGRDDDALKAFAASTAQSAAQTTDPALQAGMALDQVEALIQEGQNVEELSRLETANLHAGDPENRALWERFMPHCLLALEAIYRRLGVAFDVQLGESFYDPMLAGVVQELQEEGLAVESRGATVVFADEAKAPFIVRKSDGAYTYATTDLATIEYRAEHFHPDQVLYVVDHRQADHFKQLFEVARRWGFDRVHLEHVAFGTILGPDRRPFRTRSGDTVELESLLEEAVEKARKVVDENSPELPEEERQAVAEIVGIGAIKYADLSQNRLSDYVFDWDKMMALSGNTATYMQYAYARNRSIIRKAGTTPEAIRESRPPILIDHPSERALVVQLLRLPEAVALAGEGLKPNIVTDYLFALANHYSTFFENCPVLKAENETQRQSRLALCELTARVLKFGLGLLGIDVVERM